MAELKSSWEVIQAAGEPQAVIRVTNLQATAIIATDAWGQKGKLQPILLSVSVCLRHPFYSASESDTVSESTVHYGVLSKAILEAVNVFNKKSGHVYIHGKSQSLRALLDHISVFLTNSYVDTTSTSAHVSENPLLQSSTLSVLKLCIKLPKASLIGDGVSLSSITAYSTSPNSRNCFAMGLKLHNLRIPTLIGVNPNERLAKQIVVANVEIDLWPQFREDLESYPALEEVVVKTIEESSFQTLEALSSHLGRRIMKYYLLPRSNANTGFQNIKICLEKPTAVTWADAPAVETTLSSDWALDVPKRLKLEWDAGGRHQLPFPLQRRLDDWIRENEPNDTT